MTNVKGSDPFTEVLSQNILHIDYNLLLLIVYLVHLLITLKLLLEGGKNGVFLFTHEITAGYL